MWDITEPFESSQADEAAEGEALNRTEKGLPTSLGDSHGPKVGIIGRGHLGKQPARAFLMLSWTLCTSIHVSTRCPETLPDLQKQVLACFYDNTQLVAWVDVAFLCCLLSHLPSICSVVRPAIQKHGIVYSLVTTVPLLRTFRPHDPTRAVRPTAGSGHLLRRSAARALREPPLPLPGKIRVNAEWLVAIFCAALNSSTRQSLPHQKALKLLSDLCVPERCPICAEQKTSCPRFLCKSFASKGFASSRTQEGTFPCFDLTAAQLRQPPFSQLLEKSELVQRHLALL
ncbi:LOW QUALITY PROTEIN: NADP-dependent oxidoreductase domain-containing protein 1 [Buteo buteo]|uniref:LOW QUALITY PROTEIN: NADP-dependent oxidoreductase domain-containing protein 1 n=1 Tax=Buteo buteo TaxID=30397 RepID=UPI003EBD744E